MRHDDREKHRIPVRRLRMNEEYNWVRFVRKLHLSSIRYSNDTINAPSLSTKCNSFPMIAKCVKMLHNPIHTYTKREKSKNERRIKFFKTGMGERIFGILTDILGFSLLRKNGRKIHFACDLILKKLKNFSTSLMNLQNECLHHMH